MVNKLIFHTIIEIIIVLVFVFLSIPLWQFLSNHFNNGLNRTISASMPLELMLNHVDGFDNVIVNNGYHINKSYQVLLVADKNCNEEIITINGVKSKLENFQNYKEDDTYIYILDSNNIKASRVGYKIDTKIDEENINYHYELA